MMNIKAAYGTPMPESGKDLPKAMVQVRESLCIEMQIVTKWLEGKRYRYNLISTNRMLLGWNGDLVVEL